MPKKIIKKKMKHAKKVAHAAKKHIQEHKKHLQKIKSHVKALSKEASPPPPAHNFLRFFPQISWHARRGFLVALALAVIAAGSSAFFASGAPQKSQKLIQVSTLVAKNNRDEVSLIATGDILPARYVEFKMRQAKDYTLPFQKSADFLKSADITFGNLESPLLKGGNTPKDSTTFRADPESVKGLVFAGYDVLSLANNHTMNYQVPGLTSTIKELKKAGIAASGAGKNQDVAHTPVIKEVKGKRIAFHSYVDEKIAKYGMGIAKLNTPGVARMNIESMKNDVKNAKALADFVVVSMHAGTEYTREPTQWQKDFAHAAIDAGASVVLGTHPHVVQPVERYMDGVIFYSLGNFVFDQFFSEAVQTGLVARIFFGEKGEVEYELYPVKIEKTVPRILEGEERENVLLKYGLE